MTLARAVILPVCLILAMPSLAIGQTGGEQPGPVEMVRMYGPDETMLTPESISLAEKMLQWQLQLSGKHIEHLENLRGTWSDELRDVEMTIHKAEAEMSSRGMPPALDRNSLADLAQKLVDAEVQLGALAAKREVTEKMIVTTRADFRRATDEIYAAERQHKAELLDAAVAEFDQIQQLHEKGQVSSSELRAAELKVREFKFNLQKLELERERGANEQNALESDLQDLAAQINYQEKVVSDLRAKLDGVQSPFNHVTSLGRRREFLERNIEQCEREIISIRIRESESAALLALIEDAKKDAPSTDSNNDK